MTFEPKAVDREHLMAWVILGLRLALRTPMIVGGLAGGLIVVRMAGDMLIGEMVQWLILVAQPMAESARVGVIMSGGLVGILNGVFALGSAMFVLNVSVATALTKTVGERPQMSIQWFNFWRRSPGMGLWTGPWLMVPVFGFCTVGSLTISNEPLDGSAIARWVLDAAWRVAFMLGGCAMLRTSALGMRLFDTPLMHRTGFGLGEAQLMLTRVLTSIRNPWLREMKPVLVLDLAIYLATFISIWVKALLPPLGLVFVVVLVLWPFVHVQGYLDIFEDGGDATKLIEARRRLGKSVVPAAGLKG